MASISALAFCCMAIDSCCSDGRNTCAADGPPVPRLIEFTFHRKDRVKLDPDVTPAFPHPLDRDNVRNKPPLPLPRVRKFASGGDLRMVNEL